MQIFFYDPATGVYLPTEHEQFADQDQLDPDNWLVPAFATTAEPLPPMVGKTVNYINGQWAYVDVVIAPLTTLTDEALRNVKYEEISLWRSQQEWTAITFNHAGHDWDGGLQVKVRLDTVAALPVLPPDYYWTDANNNDVPMDLSGVKSLRAAHEIAIAGRGWEIHQRQRSMKAEIANLSGKALFEFSPRWPE